MFNKKSILITGGTGSLGKELISQITKNYKPKRLIIFSRDELKQYNLEKTYPESKYPYLRYFLGDVRDYERLKTAFNDVDYIIHAAAMKQVEASEYNPQECIKTNVEGAKNIIKASIENNVKKIIALSTDKAVNPINLYGASKLCSDKLFIAANNMVGNKNILFSVVRYGNVLESRGSIIPNFIDLISKGIKTLPITHKEMTRFIITKKMGAKFVINSLNEMKGGEIFIPKLFAIKICDLVAFLFNNPKMKFIGIRPGEKLHETLIPKEESMNCVEFKDYYLIKPSIKFYKNRNYQISKSGNKGKNIENDLDYSSNQIEFLANKKDIRLILEKIDYKL